MFINKNSHILLNLFDFISHTHLIILIANTFFNLKEEIDEKDLLFIENISNIKFDNNYMNFSLNNSLNNLQNNGNNKVEFHGSNTSFNTSTNSQRKRLKPAESLTKSPLSKWNEPIEDWRALVTEDIFDKDNDFLKQQTNKQLKTPTRRYTMNVFDVSKNLSTLNIFSTAEKNRKRENRVSKNWKLAKSRLITPSGYMKSGPGYHDFGFVSLQELVKVRSFSWMHIYTRTFINVVVVVVLCIYKVVALRYMLGNQFNKKKIIFRMSLS
jgi:hypothetical protein